MPRGNGGWFGRFDETSDSDFQEGAYREPQVFVRGLRQTEVRGDRGGAVQDFRYASTQFLAFKPDLTWNIQETLVWLLAPSLWLNSGLLLYTAGVSTTLLSFIWGIPLATMLFLLGYAYRLNRSLSLPIAYRLTCVVISLLLL